MLPNLNAVIENQAGALKSYQDALSTMRPEQRKQTRGAYLTAFWSFYKNNAQQALTAFPRVLEHALHAMLDHPQVKENKALIDLLKEKAVADPEQDNHSYFLLALILLSDNKVTEEDKQLAQTCIHAYKSTYQAHAAYIAFMCNYYQPLEEVQVQSTEIKKVTKKKEKLHPLLRVLISSLPIGPTLTDSKTRVALYSKLNDTVIQHLPYLEDEMVVPAFFYHKKNKDKFKSLMEDAIRALQTAASSYQEDFSEMSNDSDDALLHKNHIELSLILDQYQKYCDTAVNRNAQISNASQNKDQILARCALLLEEFVTDKTHYWNRLENSSKTLKVRYFTNLLKSSKLYDLAPQKAEIEIVFAELITVNSRQMSSMGIRLAKECIKLMPSASNSQAIVTNLRDTQQKSVETNKNELQLTNGESSEHRTKAKKKK